MANLILKTYAGDSFTDIAAKAKQVSANGPTVQFDFNGIKCLVNTETNLDWLWRDYLNSCTMDWKEIGPACVENYSPDVQKELDKRKKAADKKRDKEAEAYRLKQEKARASFEQKIKGVQMEFSNEESWRGYVEANQDPYGKCCVDYAEAWAKLMQVSFAKGERIADCAERTSGELDFFGITGFMYGAAVSMLAQCWKHGEALRMWHNLKTQIRDEGEKANESGGVLNPALMTIGK